MMLVEGVGGAMVPLDAEHTVRDWIAALKHPALLIAGSYLGTISHTLTAAEALLSRGVAIAAIVINESEVSPVPHGGNRRRHRPVFCPMSRCISFPGI